MKKKFLKKVSLFLTLETIFSNLPNVSAGNGLSKTGESKPVKDKEFYVMILNNPFNSPWYSADGGRAYYNAWHNIQGNAFDMFLKKYSKIIDNKTPANTLNDSERDAQQWDCFPTFGNAYEFLSFELPDTIDSSKFLVRVDKKNKIIYTIRKNGSDYLCKFYIAVEYGDTGKVATILSYNWVLNSENAVKNILLPIDKELLKQN